MRTAIVGRRGRAGLYFAILLKKRDADPRHHRLRAQRAGRHVRLGGRLLRRDPRRFEEADRETHGEITRALRALGRDRHPLPRARCSRSTGHGFCGARARDLLGILQAPVRRAWASTCVFATRGRRPRRPSRDARPRRRRRRREQRAAARGTPTHFQPVARLQPQRSTSGSAPTCASTPSRSSSRRTSTASSRCTPIPSTTGRSTFIVECREDVVAQAGLDRRRRGADRRVPRGAVRATSSTATGCSRTARCGRTSPPCATSVAPRERRAPRRRRAHRALLDRLGHEAGDGGRDRARGRLRRPAGRRPCPTRSPPTRRSGRPRWRDAARGADEPRVVREHRALHATSRRSQFAFSLLTRSKRITYDEPEVRDPGFVRGCAPTSRRMFPGRAVPPMFTPFSAARARACANRVVVSPMCQYSAVDGMPGDFHLVHLGAPRASAARGS